MILGKKHDERGKIPEHYYKKRKIGKYLAEGKKRIKDIYMYIASIIYMLLGHTKRREKFNISESHYQSFK